MARVGHEPASVDVLAERLATDLASALGDRLLSLAAHGSWVAGDRQRRRRTRSGPLCSGGPSGGEYDDGVDDDAVPSTVPAFVADMAASI